MPRTEPTENAGETFISALRFRALTPVYDMAVRLMGSEGQWRSAFVRQISPKSGQRILELGCGTGSLTVRLAAAEPTARIVGLDADPEVLHRAHAKLAAASSEAVLIEGYVDDPPRHPELKHNSFDHIATSLMFHHLSREKKRAALMSAMALLKPGGLLHIADWAEARDWSQRIRFLTIQCLDGFESTGDNVHGVLPFLIREAGFIDVVETSYARTRYGPFAFYIAKKGSGIS